MTEQARILIIICAGLVALQLATATPLASNGSFSPLARLSRARALIASAMNETLDVDGLAKCIKKTLERTKQALPQSDTKTSDTQARGLDDKRPAINGGVPFKLDLSKLIPWSSEYNGHYSDAYGSNPSKFAGFHELTGIGLKLFKFLENIRNQAESLIFELAGFSRPTPVKVPKTTPPAARSSSPQDPPRVVQAPPSPMTVIPDTKAAANDTKNSTEPEAAGSDLVSEMVSGMAGSKLEKEILSSRKSSRGDLGEPTPSSNEAPEPDDGLLARQTEKNFLMEKLAQMRTVTDMLGDLVKNPDFHSMVNSDWLEKLTGPLTDEKEGDSNGDKGEDKAKPDVEGSLLPKMFNLGQVL